ncbi:MAG: hypothetical protein P0Y65_19385 [Candidatus Devosia phytovorans]|uniref:Uncharacterized protein n=1 Tax=Candidatus Devosia phytovorans TaxID=3121372 RepID=A0AAJ6B0I7_9HYPH|nr:hypothetical protein [Devosia sp.]WEK04314.1 MAG: hypothetical protein P0Y65_19385 [Devosia sp.]
MRLIWIGLLFAPLASPCMAETVATDWPAEKCAVYEAAWNQSLDAFGSDEMNFAFLAGNENFIASGCSEAGEICPRSEQELEIANALSLAMINAGAASTFLPFHCPQPESAADGWSGPGL